VRIPDILLKKNFLKSILALTFSDTDCKITIDRAITAKGVRRMFGRKPVMIAMAAVMFVTAQGIAQDRGYAQGFSQMHSAQAQRAAVQLSAFTRTLKRGNRGSDVVLLQRKLTELGFFDGTCDGIFGRVTENAVKTFQQEHSLRADGIVGPATYAAIFGSSSTTPETPTTPTYTFGKLNSQIMLKKGSRGSNVKDLQSALSLKGFYSGKIDSVFGTSTRSAVMNFQYSVGLKADGLAGNYTLSALYTMLNPPDLTSITPWPSGQDAYDGMTIEKPLWTDADKTIFKKGMDAVIVDVRSGYVFNVRRTGGSRHADVETITPLDTATFYKSVGNFSWARRPVWVIVNGRRLAASMNCMPHGYDTLPTNDFKGQFCVHFVGSSTHSSRQVDPDHQACIEEAYQAGLILTPSPSPAPSPEPETTPTPSPVALCPVETIRRLFPRV
jgi:peptidoglycan hydrolase-like protein with peptidoglycan-binding domain